jgi:hypothetical protein
MSAITDLIGKAKGNPALLVGIILVILALAFIVGVIGGAILIFGLNLMGFAIPYTMKTMLGGAIVISCLRTIGGSSSK